MTVLPLYLLKRHPVSVEAHFDFVIVLTYAFPAHILPALLPPGLQLDTFGDLGFVAVAAVRTCKMRPRGWPELVSRDYTLIGYRIFVRYQTQAGKRLRGLKILRSDASRRSVVTAGNQMTHYNFKHAKIDFQINKETLSIKSKSQDGKSDLTLKATLNDDKATLPAGSPFTSIKEALKFAGPMPFTFDYESESNSIIRVEGVRKNWHPRPVDVEVAQADFFQQAPFNLVEPLLCSAFYISDVPYYWKSGIVEAIRTDNQAKNADSQVFDSETFDPEAYDGEEA